MIVIVSVALLCNNRRLCFGVSDGDHHRDFGFSSYSCGCLHRFAVFLHQECLCGFELGCLYGPCVGRGRGFCFHLDHGHGRVLGLDHGG